MNHVAALKLVAMISTATGQAWSEDRIKLFQNLLVASRVPYAAALEATTELLMSTDPMRIHPALVIEAARRKIPDRPRLDGPVGPEMTDKQALEKLAAHPALMRAFKRMREKMEQRAIK